MTQQETISHLLTDLNEAHVITDPEKNLRNKMESLLRSIENLTAKKLRIDYELKKQKRSLARKRQELKKSNLSLQVRLESAGEYGVLDETPVTYKKLADSIDNFLLQESFRVLDD